MWTVYVDSILVAISPKMRRQKAGKTKGLTLKIKPTVRNAIADMLKRNVQGSQKYEDELLALIKGKYTYR